MAERVLRTKDVQARLGIGRTKLWKMLRDGAFPNRRVIAEPNVKGWLESEVDAWLAARPRDNSSPAD